MRGIFQVVSGSIEEFVGFVGKQARIGNDARSAREIDMCGEIVNVIFIKIDDMLFFRKNGVSGFEDFVSASVGINNSGAKVGKRFDIHKKICTFDADF